MGEALSCEDSEECCWAIALSDGMDRGVIYMSTGRLASQAIWTMHAFSRHREPGEWGCLHLVVWTLGRQAGNSALA